MSLIKQLIPIDRDRPALKFSPASSEVNWTRVETLVHGPGAGEDNRTINSAVFACLMAIASAYPEPPLTVYQKAADGNVEKLPDHPLQEIIDYPTPNGELSTEELLFWMAWAKHIDGNAYWLKVRSGNSERGNVIELWPVSPTAIEPVSEGGEWISYYRYRVSPSRVERISVSNVVHFRLGLDDRDMRKGLAPLKALVRQISTDNEADKFMATLLSNYAVPGLVVIPSANTTLSEPDADRITDKLRRKFGNDNRGNIAVMSKESKIEQFGFSPKDLDMTVLHRVPEERISAVMGVPAIVAGLGAGLERATYDNARAMGEWFTERKLIPQWRSDAAKLNTSLKPDFESDRSIYLDFDKGDVRALQEDENAKYERLQKAVAQKAWMTRNEARTDVGLDPIDEWDEADVTKPAPVPPQLMGQPAPAGAQNGNGNKPEEEREAELRMWKRWALKRVDNGGFDRDFETKFVPPALAGAIAGALEMAKTVMDVEAIFDNQWLGYP